MAFLVRRKQRVARQVIRDRERFAQLAVGGSRDRPFVVAAASVIEVRVRHLQCPQCEGDYTLKDHRAPAAGIRQVTVMCNLCGISRDLWFRLGSTDPN